MQNFVQIIVVNRGWICCCHKNSERHSCLLINGGGSIQIQEGNKTLNCTSYWDSTTPLFNSDVFKPQNTQSMSFQHFVMWLWVMVAGWLSRVVNSGWDADSVAVAEALSPAAGGSLQLTSNFAALWGETDAVLPHTNSHFIYPPLGFCISHSGCDQFTCYPQFTHNAPQYLQVVWSYCEMLGII